MPAQLLCSRNWVVRISTGGGYEIPVRVLMAGSPRTGGDNFTPTTAAITACLCRIWWCGASSIGRMQCKYLPVGMPRPTPLSGYAGQTRVLTTAQQGGLDGCFEIAKHSIIEYSKSSVVAMICNIARCRSHPVL